MSALPFGQVFSMNKVKGLAVWEYSQYCTKVKDKIKGALLTQNQKIYKFVCTSQPQSTYEIMPLWNIQTTELDPIAL